MRQLVVPVDALSLLSAPAQAAVSPYPMEGVRTGAFIGARFKVSLGNRVGSAPKALLGIAPLRARRSAEGAVHTSIGDGLALSFSADFKPSVTFAGNPVSGGAMRSIGKSFDFRLVGGSRLAPGSWWSLR